MCELQAVNRDNASAEHRADVPRARRSFVGGGELVPQPRKSTPKRAVRVLWVENLAVAWHAAHKTPRARGLGRVFALNTCDAAYEWVRLLAD